MRPIERSLYQGEFACTNRFDNLAGTPAYECGRLWWVEQGGNPTFREFFRPGLGSVRWYHSTPAAYESILACYDRDLPTPGGAVFSSANLKEAKYLGSFPGWSDSELFEYLDSNFPMAMPRLQDGQVWALVSSQTVISPLILQGPKLRERAKLDLEGRGPKWYLHDLECFESDFRLGFHLHHLKDGFQAADCFYSTPATYFIPQLLLDPLNQDRVWSL